MSHYGFGGYSLTPDDAIDQKPCGSVHPNYPNLVCVRRGKCQMDWHMGIIQRGEWENYVYWGKDVESIKKMGGLVEFKVIPIREKTNENKD